MMKIQRRASGKKRTQMAWLLLNEKGEPIRLFWSRLIARTEAKLRWEFTVRVVRCQVEWIEPPRRRPR